MRPPTRWMTSSALHPQGYHLAGVVIIAAGVTQFWNAPLRLLVMFLPALALLVSIKVGVLAWGLLKCRRRKASAVRFAAPVTLHVGADPSPPELWSALKARIQVEHPQSTVTFRFTCRFGAHDRDCQEASVGLDVRRVQVSMCRRLYLIDPLRSAYTLTHEAAHVTGRRLPMTIMLGPVSLVTGLLVGALLPAPIGVKLALVHVLYMASMWGVEISCDLESQRLVGREAAVRCWELSTAGTRRMPWTKKLLVAVSFAVLGTHPPSWVRLLLARYGPVGGTLGRGAA